MKVTYNGTPLDMPDEGVEMQIKTIMDGGEVVDGYTQTLSLPMTANNLRLLDLYAPMERAVDTWKVLEVEVQVDGWAALYKGRLSVQGVSWETREIEASIYFALMPTEIIDKPLRELVGVSNETTPWPWDYRRGDVTIYGYNGGADNMWCHPSVSVPYLLNLIATRNGLTITPPGPAADWRVLLSSKYASVQVFEHSVEFKFSAGEQQIAKVTAAGVCYYGETSADGDGIVMQMAGTCNVNTRVPATTQFTINVGQIRDGQTIDFAVAGGVKRFTVQAGDIIKVYIVSTDQWAADLYVAAQFSYNVTATAEDDGRQLMEWAGAAHQHPRYGNITEAADMAWQQFPLWLNLPDLSLREFVSLIALLSGTRPRVSATGGLYFEAPADVTDNDAQFIATRRTERVRGVTRVGIDEGSTAPAPTHTIAGTSGEGVVFEAPLYLCREWAYVCYIRQYDGSGEGAAKLNDIKSLVVATDDGVSATLAGSPAMPDPLQGVTHAQEVECETTANILHADTLTVRGHKLLLTAKDYDERGRVWHVKGYLY